MTHVFVSYTPFLSCPLNLSFICWLLCYISCFRSSFWFTYLTGFGPPMTYLFDSPFCYLLELSAPEPKACEYASMRKEHWSARVTPYVSHPTLLDDTANEIKYNKINSSSSLDFPNYIHFAHNIEADWLSWTKQMNTTENHREHHKMTRP